MQLANLAVQGQTGTMQLLRRPAVRVECEAGLRDGSTGRVVYVAPARLRLERVWAVAQTSPVPPTEGERSEEQGKPSEGLAFYRKYTEALLRRYLRLSTQAGRIPSMMSRDVFRGNVTHYRVSGFEDVVIFCHDVEQRLCKLDNVERELLKRVVLQRYTQGETAGMLGMDLKTCWRRYGQAVDHLTSLLLEVGLLDLSRR